MVKDKNMKNENSTIEMPFVSGWVFPVECLYKNFKSFCYLAGGLALLAGFVTLCLGRGLACGYGLTEPNIYCFDTVWSVLGSGGVFFASLVFFINRWWLIAFKNVLLKDAIREMLWVKDLKTLGFLLLFLAAIAVVGGGVYFLYFRRVTPHLDLEIGLFVLASLVIFSGLGFLMNAVVFVRFLEGKSWLVFNKTMLPVFDNLYKLVGWFLFYMFLFIYLLRQAGLLFAFCQRFLPLWLSSLIGDFAIYFAVYCIIACFVALLQYQAKYIFGDEAVTE